VGPSHYFLLTSLGINSVYPALRTLPYDKIRLDQLKSKGDAVYKKKIAPVYSLAGIRELNNVLARL
jgi:hypothetical protein